MKRKIDVSNNVQSVADEELEREHEESTKVKNIKVIEMGRFEMDAWYFSPYPDAFALQQRDQHRGTLEVRQTLGRDQMIQPERQLELAEWSRRIRGQNPRCRPQGAADGRCAAHTCRLPGCVSPSPALRRAACLRVRS